MTVGERMTELRKQRGYYQKEIADYLKVSVGTISNYENGRHYPDPDTLCRIADFFDITCDYLLGRTTYCFDPDVLNQIYTSDYKLSDCVDTMLELDPQNRNSLADYLDLLKRRNQETNSNN